MDFWPNIKHIVKAYPCRAYMYIKYAIIFLYIAITF